MYVKDISGMVFKRVTAIKATHERNHGSVVWICSCECGNIFKTTTNSLLSGNTVSCGCYRREKAVKMGKMGDGRRTHSLSKTRIYDTWIHMKDRCNNPNNKGYKNYGGRGIKVCDEWEKSFIPFYEYVSHLPHYGEEKRSIDRINNDGNYEPGNIRWATRYEQTHNRRKTQIGNKSSGV